MSTADYSKAVWLPSPNFWAGGDGNQLIVVHATASGGPQTGYQLATSAEFTDGKSKSVHYINDVDGTVYQIVNEANSSWGNCCVDGNAAYSSTYNWNRNTISIENVKHSSDNSEPLTAAQYQSLLALIRDIAKRNSIPLAHGSPTTKGIIFHHDLMPIQKAGCPGNFPYATFFQDVQQGGGQVVSVKLNSTGCVCDTILWYQLSRGAMELCGIAAVVAMLASGSPGSGPAINPATGKPWTPDNIGDRVAVESAAMGYPDPKTFPGVSIPDEERIFRDEGIHYQEITPDWTHIQAANKAGYPVVITGFEPNIWAWHPTQHTWVPAYPWGPTTPANHVFPVGGFDQNGNPICYDQLNNAFQGYWPPTYDAARLKPSYAAVVQLPFLQIIPGADPTAWPAGFNAQLANGGLPMPLPTGAKDDGTAIHFANSPLVITRGFRTLYNSLAAAGRVPSDDTPLNNEYGCNPVEQSNPAFWQTSDQAKGTAQETRYFRLGYSPAKGGRVTYIGQELRWYADQYTAAQAQILALKAQVATLEAAIAAATGGSIPQVVLDDISHLAGLIPPAAAALETLMHDARIVLPPPATVTKEEENG